VARYQVALIQRPDQWQPTRPDDVPAWPGSPQAVLSETDDLFAAVRQAVEHNQGPAPQGGQPWAVVVDPGTCGRTWMSGRLCTPISYKVITIWWPEGWEPTTPLDVPNCLWHARKETEESSLSYAQALATVQALNRQCMDAASATWYVVAAVENEPLEQTVSYDSAGAEVKVEVRRLHVIRPEQGGKGDCSHCPAHSLPCAQEEWSSRAQAVTETHRSAPVEL